jgi:Leucine-rich repeat (LRR) protein
LGVLQRAESIEKTIQCTISNFLSQKMCEFEKVSFDRNTKLKIERIGDPETKDEDIKTIGFKSSNISLIHPDILAKFPNINWGELNQFQLNYIENQEMFENCGQITEFRLFLKNFTGITSNTFVNCSNLKRLTIITNSLTDLPDGLYRNQQNLQRLHLVEDGLSLRVKAFEGLTSLTELVLYSMGLGRVEDDLLHSLKRLGVLTFAPTHQKYNHNFPVELLRSHETLQDLFMNWGNWSQLPDNFGPILGSMKRLRRISFSNNLIRSVEAFVDLPTVEQIELPYNQIEKLPANAFKGCPRLNALSLSSNPISSFRGDEFNQLSGLGHLNLHATQLKTIAPTTFHPLVNLQYLTVRSKPLKINTITKELFLHSINLTYLDLSFNQIEAIHQSAFDNLQRLGTLNLKENKCVNEKFEVPFNKVLDLELVKEKLKICFDNFPEKKLVCQFSVVGIHYVCYIQKAVVGANEAITIVGDHQPGKLDSDVNSVIFIESKLHEIPREIFTKFENLKELNVESTELEELNHLENCGSLETFRAGFNNIVKINDETFKDCKNLRTVDLQSNKIEKLGKTVFKHNEKLWQVNLSRNEINGIEPCGFLGNQPELQSVNFLGNQCVHHDIQIVNGNFTDLEKKLIPCYMAWYSEILATPS